MLDEMRLKKILSDLPASKVTVSENDGAFVATVISTSFEGRDDAERQATVWAHLLQCLSNGDQEQVEFVFTLTPEEAFTAPPAGISLE